MPNDYSNRQYESNVDIIRRIIEIQQNNFRLLSLILVAEGYIAYRLEKMDQKIDNLAKPGTNGKA
jgi:hypothetical protein